MAKKVLFSNPRTFNEVNSTFEARYNSQNHIYARAIFLGLSDTYLHQLVAPRVDGKGVYDYGYRVLYFDAEIVVYYPDKVILRVDPNYSHRAQVRRLNLFLPKGSGQFKTIHGQLYHVFGTQKTPVNDSIEISWTADVLRADGVLA